MALSGTEIATIIAMLGTGKLPYSGGPAASLSPSIAQTIPWEIASTAFAPSTGVMYLSAIYLNAGQTVKNINYVTVGAATGPTHLLFALYDDGRSSTSANQLGLLAQTADQGSAAINANTNIGLSLILPYTTSYSGLYYTAFVCAVATTMPTLQSSGGTSAIGTQISPSAANFLSMSAGSSLTSSAPNPSGAITSLSTFVYAYVS